jgi:hypothetical protein
MGTYLSIEIQKQDVSWMKPQNLNTEGTEFYLKGPLLALPSSL